MTLNKNQMYIDNVLIHFIPHEKCNAISKKALKDITGFSLIEIKRAITRLRNNYPILYQNDAVGGYWVSSSPKEIKETCELLEKTIKTMENTKKKLEGFIDGEN